MKKRYYFLVFVTAVSVCFININVYAQTGNQDVQTEEYLDKDFEEDFLDDYSDMELFPGLADPIYPYNYFMYTFNDVFYTAVLKPVTCYYKALTPSCLRRGVNNFFINLMFPVRLANNLLQGKFRESGIEAQIFLINSTIGVAGLCQVAQERFNLNLSKEDFRQTLGFWSIDNGFYLVLPFIGPSTLRDSIGLAGDYFLNPVNYLKSLELSYGLKALDLVNYTSFHVGDYESLKKAALNPYEALKDAYLQNMNTKIRR